jgi:hypothetical protein
MDGLLCDLFNYIGQKIYGKNYHDVTSEEKQEARKIWKDKQMFYKTLGGVYNVFANLEPFPTNDILIEAVINKFGSFYICSHPSDVDRKKCIEGKDAWIKKYIIPKYGKYFKGALYPQHKSIYAVNEDESSNVLIDDFQPYIDAWNDKGGIAIKLQSSRFDNITIKDYLDREFTKIRLQESFKTFYRK